MNGISFTVPIHRFRLISSWTRWQCQMTKSDPISMNAIFSVSVCLYWLVEHCGRDQTNFGISIKTNHFGWRDQWIRTDTHASTQGLLRRFFRNWDAKVTHASNSNAMTISPARAITRHDFIFHSSYSVDCRNGSISSSRIFPQIKTFFSFILIDSHLLKCTNAIHFWYFLFAVKANWWRRNTPTIEINCSSWCLNVWNQN